MGAGGRGGLWRAGVLALGVGRCPLCAVACRRVASAPAGSACGPAVAGLAGAVRGMAVTSLVVGCRAVGMDWRARDQSPVVRRTRARAAAAVAGWLVSAMGWPHEYQ